MLSSSKVRRVWRAALAFAGIMLTSEAFAQELPCEIQSSQDILACIASRHPEAVDAEAISERDRRLEDISRQGPNPEFETRISAGTDSGSAALKTETGFFPILELGGKRNARMQQAEAGRRKAELELVSVRERLVRRAVLCLHRLRQIGEEKARVAETLRTFGRTLENFRRRPQLTPEQEATQASFELGRQEYQLREAALLQEEIELQSFLELGTGHRFADLRPFLPKGKPRLPEVPDVSAIVSNSEVEFAKNEIRGSDADLAAAKAKSWPDLKVGPVLETESLSSSTFSVTGGMGLALPLPLFNRAQGERAYATLDRRRAELKLADALRKSNLERRDYRNAYERARVALRQVDNFDQARGRHDKIEHSFELGVVSGALVIEAHRQLYEILTARNSQEIEALRALWTLYLLEGRALKESI